MYGLVVILPLDIGKSKDEVLEFGILNTVSNIIYELIIPYARPWKFLAPLKVWELSYRVKQGVDLMFY